MTSISLIVFLSVISFFIFIYIVYPFLFLAVAFLAGKKQRPADSDFFPAVSIIICAKDEETHIEEKIINMLELDYPGDKREIIVVSDGSTDDTNSIVARYGSRIKPVLLKATVGKTEAQNIAVKECSGEILIFSDANSVVDKSALLNIVRHFKDPKTAGVSGCLSYFKKGSDGNMEAQYNNLDVLLKKGESAFNVVFGSFGTLYAIRKNCYQPLPPHIISDFVEPVLQLIHGYKNIFEPEARSIEKVNQTMKLEMKRKSRIVLRSMIGYFYLIQSGLAKKPLLFIHSLFRKFFRWLLPLYLIICAISLWIFFLSFGIAPFIIYNVFLIVLILITVFSSFKRTGKNAVLNLFFYFFILNVSTIDAFIKICKGEKITSWKPRQ